MEAFVDSREPDEMKNMCDYESKELPQGDFYLPEHDVVVERKEASDFAGSTTNGRLSEQADRMIDEHEHCYLILENDVRIEGKRPTQPNTLYNLSYSDISDHSIIGMQTSLAVKRSIKIIYTESQEQTLYAVKRIFERHRDGEAGDGGRHVKTHDTGEVDDVQVAMLMQIDGISEEKAEEILGTQASLGSMVWALGEGMVNDVKKQIMSVDGVGEVLAKRVINAFK